MERHNDVPSLKNQRYYLMPPQQKIHQVAQWFELFDYNQFNFIYIYSRGDSLHIIIKSNRILGIGFPKFHVKNASRLRFAFLHIQLSVWLNIDYWNCNLNC
jgi:hypothetical protein